MNAVFSEERWAMEHRNASGLPADHPHRVAARKRAETFVGGERRKRQVGFKGEEKRRG